MKAGNSVSAHFQVFIPVFPGYLISHPVGEEANFGSVRNIEANSKALIRNMFFDVSCYSTS